MAPANKKAWVWIAASVVVVLLLGGLVFLLFMALAQSNEAATKLESERVRLENYYARNPFPNTTNVIVEKSNAATWRQWREELLRTLSANQIEAPSKTPAGFEIFLSAKAKELREAAMRNTVKVPPGFAFGFARYSEGRGLPDSRDDLPTRLAEQLVLVDHVCRLLFEEKIVELVSVTRDEFAVEKSDVAGPGPGPGGPGKTGPSGAARLPRTGGQPGMSPPAASDRSLSPSGYRKLHFAFELRLREGALTGILNRLSSDPIFIVVTSVEIDAPVDAQLGTQPKREDVTNTVGRAARIVCDPELAEPAQVKIELDIYRF